VLQVMFQNSENTISYIITVR